MTTSANEMKEKYFPDHTEMVLTSQERAALAIGQKWQTGTSTSKPVAAEDGSIRYVYGSGQIQIMCAILQVCDIKLQQGEQVNNLNVGDPRFMIESAITGNKENRQQHLLIKPLDVGLDTSMVVTTTRRTYHFRLRSSAQDFMPYVSFMYPDEIQAKWSALRADEAKQRTDSILPRTGEYLGNLNFDYEVAGSARWKPSRVYNDGVKTIIEMPSSLQQSEAPTLLVLRKGNGWFNSEETVMVNYRLQGNRYIVDTIFDKAILIAGVGSGQDRVTITKGK